MCVLGVDRGMALLKTQLQVQARLVEFGKEPAITPGWPRL
jgi:hypothetical protein